MDDRLAATQGLTQNVNSRARRRSINRSVPGPRSADEREGPRVRPPTLPHIWAEASTAHAALGELACRCADGAARHPQSGAGYRNVDHVGALGLAMQVIRDCRPGTEEQGLRVGVRIPFKA